jgi:hypothetical protein
VAMEVGSGKRQNNHTIVIEDSIKTANSIVIWIPLESVTTELALTRYMLGCPIGQSAMERDPHQPAREDLFRTSPKFNRLFPPIPRSLRAPADIGVTSRARGTYEP